MSKINTRYRLVNMKSYEQKMCSRLECPHVKYLYHFMKQNRKLRETIRNLEGALADQKQVRQRTDIYSLADTSYLVMYKLGSFIGL